ncbi:uncharacterized protein LAJ45_04774 [Morchella importuna]|uniref:uncharacterized protein n=1 Tax=Morchella importuna TaxID=1174673 RepID=UPI001E8CB47D|nr:uncharacterized protein LAJ45_04774 [Morchella importuna]KAH8151072.1 hypothetical protein LAJ45_04774 [Morchella importuna]
MNNLASLLLTECDATAESRASYKEHDTIVKLLWTASGIEAATKIWKQLAKWRHGKEGRSEETEKERRELGYGWGTLNDARDEFPLSIL